MSGDGSQSRRDILKGIAATGLGGLAVGTAKGGHQSTISMEYSTVRVEPPNMFTSPKRSLYMSYAADNGYIRMLQPVNVEDLVDFRFATNEIEDDQCTDMSMGQGVDEYNSDSYHRTIYYILDQYAPYGCYGPLEKENVSIGDTVWWEKGNRALKYDGSTLYCAYSGEISSNGGEGSYWELKQAEIQKIGESIELPASGIRGVAGHNSTKNGEDAYTFTYLHKL